MISVSRNNPTNGSPIRRVRFSQAARRAIAKGVSRDDPVAELEYLGLTLRTMNMLENCDYGITRLEQLMARTADELLEIPNFTVSQVKEILDSLARYHKLDEAKQHAPPLKDLQPDEA